MQKGLMLLWSSYLVVETLLAAVAIQPLISIQGLASPKNEACGLLWTLALLSDDLMGLAVTAVFLGYLLSVPGKLTWIWLCRIEVGGFSIGAWVYWFLSFPLNETRSLEEEEQPLAPNSIACSSASVNRECRID